MCLMDQLLTGTYTMPGDGSRMDYVKYVETFPLSVSPDVFGFHSNATITKDQNETNLLFKSILLTQDGSGGGGDDDDEGGGEEEEEEEEDKKSGGGSSRDDVVLEVASSNLSKIPELFDMESCQLRYPIKWEESMNTVITQELDRFNSLRTVIFSSLNDIQKAVKGVVVMSDELESLGDSLYYGKVPELWLFTSYPSLKPLAPYMTDLLARLAFMKKWLETEPPVVFWLSGLFFTTAFLTGAKQNFSRKYTIPIDAVSFDFEFIENTAQDTLEKPEDGAYCRGLYFDGARWDSEGKVLAQPEPKVLFSQAPIIWMKPMKIQDISEYKHYNCPVYKTSERWGILATTGHSTNFVMYIRIPSNQEEKTWILAGIALLTQLDN